jgi:hypothetical protein
MGTSASSLLHRRAVRRHGNKPLPDRRDEGEKQDKQEEFLFFEEERQGPAAMEARGAMLRDRARRREGTVFNTWDDLRESALCFLVALNCKYHATNAPSISYLILRFLLTKLHNV